MCRFLYLVCAAEVADPLDASHARLIFRIDACYLCLGGNQSTTSQLLSEKHRCDILPLLWRNGHIGGGNEPSHRPNPGVSCRALCIIDTLCNAFSILEML